MTTRHDGTIIYTPFPDYEVEDPPGSGANTVRTTYRLAGQIIAVQTKVGKAAGTFYYTYTDHLGNFTALITTAGTFVTGSKAILFIRTDPNDADDINNFSSPPGKQKGMIGQLWLRYRWRPDVTYGRSGNEAQSLNV